jgi:hypothetical protein
MWGYLLWAGVIAFVIAMYTNDHFRGRTNEIWEKYFISAMKLGWPYALIYALYDTISSGALGKTIRAIVAGY